MDGKRKQNNFDYYYLITTPHKEPAKDIGNESVRCIREGRKELLL